MAGHAHERSEMRSVLRRHAGEGSGPVRLAGVLPASLRLLARVAAANLREALGVPSRRDRSTLWTKPLLNTFVRRFVAAFASKPAEFANDETVVRPPSR